MAFDFKKEYKEFYMPKNKPEIVTVPQANYIAVRGKGNPNEIDGAYQKAISILYAVAYTLKMSYKTEHKKGVSLRDFIPWKNIGIVWRNPAMPIFSVPGAVRLLQ